MLKVRTFFVLWSFSLIFTVSCQKTSLGSFKQELRLNIPSDPATLDPRKGGDVVSSIFHFLLFDGLTRLNSDGSISLAIAEKIEVSPSRTVYTFYLRNALWSNGDPITAQDFEKSWKDVLRPDFPAMNAHLLYPIKNAEKAKKGLIDLSEVGIHSLNEKILEVTLENPTPYFLELISFCVFFPVNAEIDQEHPDWEKGNNHNFICSGPFLLHDWKKTNEITLVKNPNYYRAEEICLDKIFLGMVDSEMTSLQMFEKGQIDMLGQPIIPIPTDAIAQLVKDQKLHIHPIAATSFCTFNVDEVPFNNAKVRKAFAYAINRKEIINNITQLQEEPALGIIPPVLKKSFSTSFFQDANIEQARQLLQEGLEELGITKQRLPKIKYFYCISDLQHKIAQALQQQWTENLGVNVEIESMDKKILMHQLKTRNYQIAHGFWMAQYQDPMNIFERFKFRDNVKNYPNWENEEYILLLNQSSNAESEQQRMLLLEKAEQIFLDEMPLAPIYHWNAAYVIKPYVKSFDVAPMGNGFFDRIYIDIEAKKNTP